MNMPLLLVARSHIILVEPDFRNSSIQNEKGVSTGKYLQGNKLVKGHVAQDLLISSCKF
jgi:hypothetical protein